MALSFEESLKNYQNAQLSPATFALARAVTVAEEDTEAWARLDGYTWYEEYYDDNYSTVDDMKRIKINPKHVNLSQEENSQIIPFTMPRFWDGIDLTTKKIMINFVNIKGQGSASKPINALFSDNEIKFYWLIPGEATAIAGTLKFEIYAYGTNEKDENYQWRTQINSEITILESLVGNGAIEQTESWLTYLEPIYEVANEAKTTADAAQTDVDELEVVVGDLSEQVDTNTTNIADTTERVEVLESESVDHEEVSSDVISGLFS